MNIMCPKCQEQIRISTNDWSSEPIGGHQTGCPRCQALLQISIKVDSVERIPNVEEASSPRETAVLVAVDGEATRDLIRELLQGAGYRLLEAWSGQEALSFLETEHPPLALLDVGLQEPFGFEVCERIKKSESLSDIKIILVAAIYSNTSYRREPRTLYGADDYIERHLIHSQLLPKIEGLLEERKSCVSEVNRERADTRISGVQDRPSIPPKEHRTSLLPADSSGHANKQERTPALIPSNEDPLSAVMEGPLVSSTSKEDDLDAEDKESTIVEPSPEEEPVSQAEASPADVSGLPDHQAAMRLARIIISDIALYNSERVNEAFAKNNFYELLKDEIEEGKRLYDDRVPEDVRARSNYFRETLDHYIKTRKI